MAANWDISKVKNMFQSCKQLQDITALANWDAFNIDNMTRMFYKCRQLKDMSTLSNWDDPNVEDMSEMFAHTQLNILNDTNDIKSHVQNLS